jgi:ribonuclease BN (tRNA processing enzyme)
VDPKTLEGTPLSLTTDGSLALFFVGVGSAFTKRQYQTNLLIIKGGDHVLVDCGTRCTQALASLGVNATDIKNILITHSHADHIGGLEELALMGRYMSKRKPCMIINESYQEILWEMSLRGGCAFNEKGSRPMLAFTDFFEVIRPHRIRDFPREMFGVRIGNIDIKMIRTMHIPDSAADWKGSFWSCAVMIDDRVLFTSDTRYDPDLINACNHRFNPEIIFHDCQFFTGGVHAGIDELNQFPDPIKKKIMLCHYGDNWEQNEAKVIKYNFAGFTKQQVYYLFD